MMRVERFVVEDMALLSNHGGQGDLVELMPVGEMEKLTSTGAHYSLFIGDELIACVGASELNRYRAAVWALFQSGRPETFLAVHRTGLRLLRALPYQRLEAYVDPTNPAAVRWIGQLGFRCEVPFRPYFFPDGRGASEWALYLTGDK